MTAGNLLLTMLIIEYSRSIGFLYLFVINVSVGKGVLGARFIPVWTRVSSSQERPNNLLMNFYHLNNHKLSLLNFNSNWFLFWRLFSAGIQRISCLTRVWNFPNWISIKISLLNILKLWEFWEKRSIKRC